MESRFWRTLATNAVIGLVIEYCICLAISLYFNDRDQYFYALLIMLGFWGIQIGIWVKSQTVGLIFYYLIGKQQAVARVELQLRRYKVPFYDDFAAPDATNYFAQIIGDELSNRDQLKFASSVLGGIETLREVKPTAAWKAMSVLETALESYRRREHGAISPEVAEDAYSGNNGEVVLEELSEEESNRQAAVLNHLRLVTSRAALVAWRARTGDEAEDLKQEDWQHYLVVRDEAFGLFEDLDDAFYKSAGAHFLIEMLTIAGDTDHAKALLDCITIDFIKEKAASDLASGARALYAQMYAKK